MKAVWIIALLLETCQSSILEQCGLRTPVSVQVFLTKSIPKYVHTATTIALLFGSVPANAAEQSKEVKKSSPKVRETDLGIKYISIKEGRGSAYPASGDFVVINYTGFLANGTVFDSTETKSRKPLSFRMGKNQVVPGLEDVVSYMKPGGIATCTIPSELAFGAKGICIENEGCLVPPNETLKYVVKLLRVGSGYN